MRIYCVMASAALWLACGPADDRLVGPTDHVAEHACEAFEDDTTTPLTAVADASSIADATITLGDTPYVVTLPEGAQSYAGLNITTEHSYLAIFTRERDVVVDVEGGDVSYRRHAICPDLIGEDVRVHIDEIGLHAMTFSDEGPREVWLQAVLESAGHDEDGGHDEDAGTASDSGP